MKLSRIHPVMAVVALAAAVTPLTARADTITYQSGIAYQQDGVVVKTPVAPQQAYIPETVLYAQRVAGTCHVSVGGSCLSASPDDNYWTCVDNPGHTYCDGADPVDGGCAHDGETVADGSYHYSGDPNGYWYEQLRWSPNCQSNWSLYESSYSNTLHAWAGYGSQGADDSRTDATYDGTSVWSNMLYGGSGTQCVSAGGAYYAYNFTVTTRCV